MQSGEASIVTFGNCSTNVQLMCGIELWFISLIIERREPSKLTHLQHMAAVPTMLALSMADEYVPCAKQPGEYSALGARMAAAAEAEVLELADADHALSKPAAASKRFVHEVAARLGAISRGETLRPAPQAAAPEPEPVLAAHRQQRSLAATRAARAG